MVALVVSLNSKLLIKAKEGDDRVSKHLIQIFACDEQIILVFYEFTTMILSLDRYFD